MKRRKKYNKICVGCGKEFIAYRSDKEFHSSKCRFDYWKLNGKHRDGTK